MADSYYSVAAVPNLNPDEASVKITSTGDYVALRYTAQHQVATGTTGSQEMSNGGVLVTVYARWVDANGAQKTFPDGSPVIVRFQKILDTPPFGPSMTALFQVVIGDSGNSLGIDVTKNYDIANAIACAKALANAPANPSSFL